MRLRDLVGFLPRRIHRVGSAYQLGQPSPAYGVDQAKRFIADMMAALTQPMDIKPITPRYTPERTIVLAAIDNSLHNVEHIELDGTSFGPLR